MEKVNIRGIDFDPVTLDGAVDICEGFIKENKQGVVFTPNAEIVQLGIEDPEFQALVNTADLIIPDGAGVVLASKILKKKLSGKVPGVELGERLIKLSAEKGYKVFFYGSKPTTDKGMSVAELANKKLGEKYPGFSACGISHGYVKADGMDELIDKINESGADILFVCLGVPMQEKWIVKNRDRLCAKVILGLGGSLDSYAGTVKRAPKIFIKLNLEWFYRLIKEPRRIGRMMKLPKFIFGTIFSKRG